MASSQKWRRTPISLTSFFRLLVAVNKAAIETRIHNSCIYNMINLMFPLGKYFLVTFSGQDDAFNSVFGLHFCDFFVTLEQWV